MTPMRDFKQVGTRGFYQPTGEVTFDEGADGVAAAIAHARRLGLADIVVNTLGLKYTRPSVVERYALALRVAESAGGQLRVAFVAPADYIDFQKIGAVMAQNRGAISDTFATEAEALRWLDARRPPAGEKAGAPADPAARSD